MEGRKATHMHQHAKNQPRLRNLREGRGANHNDQHADKEPKGRQGGGPTRTNTRGSKAKGPKGRQGGEPHAPG